MRAAIEEDVDWIGVSILSGAHRVLLPKLRTLLDENGADDIRIMAGGIIPQEDMDALATLGVGRLFGPGAATTELVDYIRTWFAERNPQPA